MLTKTYKKFAKVYKNNKKIIFGILFILITFLLSFIYLFALQGDILFSSDIARDFLLFNEIDEKTIILIGPKSSVMGLFHGPLWLYLNYPAYLLGSGDPMIVGAFWVLLTVLFVYSCFYVGKNLFNKKTGFLFALMTAVYMVFHVNTYFNPIGAMFLIPLNFYFLIKYIEKYQLKYLIIHILISGLIIQFEIAIGIPFFILSVFYLFFKLLNSKKRKHLLAIFLIVLPLFNFIIFDLRHQFLMTHSILRYLSPESGDSVKYNYLYMIFDRLKLLTINVEFLRFDPFYRNSVTGLIFILFLIVQLKDKKYRGIYFLFLYFYLGFFALTLINKGPILYFYFFPLFTFIFLIFSSFVTSRYKSLFLIIFFIMLLMNAYSGLRDIGDSEKRIGKSETSWKFLNTMAGNVFKGKEDSFGYFVYTPDIIGYGPKYALLYNTRKNKNKEVFYFQKKPITYVVVAHPAQSNPYLSYDWWKKERLKITKKPVSTINFENGYKIEKYELTDEEVKIPFDLGIDPGLSFR